MKKADKPNEELTEPEEITEVQTTETLIENRKVNGKINNHINHDEDLLVKHRVRAGNGIKL